MDNRIFSSKSCFCYGEGPVRELFLIFCRNKDKEGLNFKGRRRKEGLQVDSSLPVLHRLGRELDQNFLQRSWDSWVSTCLVLACTSDSKNECLKHIARGGYFTRNIFEAFCTWKYRLIYKFFKPKGGGHYSRKQWFWPMYNQPFPFTAPSISFSDLKYSCTMLPMQMWIVLATWNSFTKLKILFNRW